MLTVYSKSNCPFCEQAKALLERKGVEFQVVKIDENLEAKEFLMQQTTPVFIESLERELRADVEI